MPALYFLSYKVVDPPDESRHARHEEQVPEGEGNRSPKREANRETVQGRGDNVHDVDNGQDDEITFHL